jgi:uncharacterized membrane protein YdjX (TVP38/TMEM64 family)
MQEHRPGEGAARPMSIWQQYRRNLTIVGLLTIVVGLIAASDTLHDLSGAAVYWAEQMLSRSPLTGMLVFVLFAVFSAALAFFSSAVLVPIAIYAWGSGTTFALLWLGWLLGGVLAFSIGRHLGRSVAAWVAGDELLDYWTHKVGRRTPFKHILVFQAVVPSEIPGYVLGGLHYPFALYVAALAITELPYAIGTVYLGESFLAGESTVFLVLGIGVIIAAAVVWIRFKPRSADAAPEPSSIQEN